MPDNIKLLIIIADKTKQKDITKIIKKYNLYFNYIIPGYGSASSSLLDYFGLNEVKKQQKRSLKRIRKSISRNIEKETVEIFKILRNFDTSTISKSR